VSTKETVLVVDDEQHIIELIEFNLRKEGYTVVTVQSGESALEAAVDSAPSLIVLDLMLPGIDGLTVCRKLKADPDTASIPIIMLTARSDDADVVTGLELGADDYLTKPFSPRVLVARIRAVLRRRGESETDSGSGTARVGALSIDRERREAECAGVELRLSTTEFEILWLLATHPGIVFTRTRIIDAVRGEDYAITERAVDVQILGLRRRLGEYGKAIETVRGVGYRLSRDALRGE